MTDLPAPDVMDSSGRLRRLALASIVGLGAGTVAYMITERLVDTTPHRMIHASAYNTHRFIWYVTAFFCVGAFVLARAILNHVAKKKWRESLVPRAKVVG